MSQKDMQLDAEAGRDSGQIRNVVLEARTGPCSGVRFWTRPGQRVTVGRTDAADFALKRDDRISSRHFALECQPTECRIRDLKSANGTWLNGRRIEQAVLEDGMVITVGATGLHVQIETDSPAAESVPKTAGDAAAEVLRTTESEFVGDQVGIVRQEQPSVTSEPPMPEPHATPVEPSTRLPAVQQVCIEAVTGPGQGRKVWLRPPQSLVVGRTDQADFVLRRDHELSGRHFAIECDGQRVWIKDLSSRNGTYLQGVRVSESLLADGDRLRAGRTEFLVSVQGGISKEELDKQRAAAVKRPRPASPWAAPQPLTPLSRPCHYARFACRSGLWLYRGTQSVFQPGLLASRLAQLAAPCLVVDPRRWDAPNQLPADAPRLFTDDSDKAQGQSPSPRLICPAADDPSLQNMVDHGWSRDALVVVYARGDVAELTGGLQQFARGLANDPAARHVARLNPGPLADFLANSAPEGVEALLEQVAGIFLEAHQGDRWAAFATRDFDVALASIGLTSAPAWKP